MCTFKSSQADRLATPGGRPPPSKQSFIRASTMTTNKHLPPHAQAVRVGATEHSGRYTAAKTVEQAMRRGAPADVGLWVESVDWKSITVRGRSAGPHLGQAPICCV